MKKFLIYGVAILLIIFILFSIVLNYVNSKNENVTDEKLISEFKYLSNMIASILNDVNGLTIESYQIQIKGNDVEDKQSSSSSSSGSSNQQQSSGGGESGGGGEKSSQESQQSGSDTGSNSKKQTQNATGSTSNNSETASNSNKNDILAKNGKYEIKWETISAKIEQLYHSWNTIVLDLHNASINSNNILKFTTILNDVTQSSKKKNKADLMNQLCSLHELTISYVEEYKKEDLSTKLLKAKTFILYAYNYSNNDKWNEADKALKEANTIFTTILNNVDDKVIENQVLLNKCYILISELQKAITIKDKEVFLIQYVDMLKELDMIIYKIL